MVQINLFAGQGYRCKGRGVTHGPSWGRGGGTNWEISTDVYTLTEKAMAPHSSTLAWKIPWTEEPGGLQSMGLQRVGHD